MRVSKIKWYTQQENAFTLEPFQGMAPAPQKELALPAGGGLHEQEGPQTILVLLLEVLTLALEEGKLHEELINVISGILRYLRIIGDPS